MATAKAPNPNHNYALTDLLRLGLTQPTKLVMIELLRKPGRRNIHDVAERLTGPKQRFSADAVIKAVRELEQADLAHFLDGEHVSMHTATPWAACFSRVSDDLGPLLERARAVTDLDQERAALEGLKAQRAEAEAELAGLRELIRQRVFPDEAGEHAALLSELADLRTQVAKARKEAKQAATEAPGARAKPNPRKKTTTPSGWAEQEQSA